MSKKGDELREHDRLSWIERMLYPMESAVVMAPIMQELVDRNRVISGQDQSDIGLETTPQKNPK